MTIESLTSLERGSNRLTQDLTLDPIAMAIHLARYHGADNVAGVSGDRRLTDILAKCKSGFPAGRIRKLKLDQAEEITGRKFRPSLFPKHVNLVTATNAELVSVFGTWPLPVGTVPPVYRWLK